LETYQERNVDQTILFESLKIMCNLIVAVAVFSVHLIENTCNN